MNRVSNAITAMGMIAGFLALTACGGGGMVEDDSPAGQAFAYRHAVMTLAASKMATIGGMAREEMPLDEAVFVQSTKDLAALAGMNLHGFEMNQEIAAGSRALPEIWSNWNDFQQKNSDFVQATQGLADAAERGGFATAQGLVQGTAGTCGGCHRTYRQRTD